MRKAVSFVLAALVVIGVFTFTRTSPSAALEESAAFTAYRIGGARC